MASHMSMDEDDNEEEEGEMDDDDDVDEEEECTGSEEDGKPKAASRVHRRQRLLSLNWHFQECLKDVHKGRVGCLSFRSTAALMWRRVWGDYQPGYCLTTRVLMSTYLIKPICVLLVFIYVVSV